MIIRLNNSELKKGNNAYIVFRNSHRYHVTNAKVCIKNMADSIFSICYVEIYPIVIIIFYVVFFLFCSTSSFLFLAFLSFSFVFSDLHLLVFNPNENVFHCSI